MVETVGTAVAAFAATNVDDVVILAVLFARRGAGFGTGHIVAGQFIGFAVLLAISFAASLGLMALPDEAVGILGLLTVAWGVVGFVRAWRGDDEEDEVGDATLTTLGVVGITVANGADNVAIYAPLFATFGVSDAIVTMVVFAVLLVALCAAGLMLGSRAPVIRAVEHAGAYAIPVVLVLLGVIIVAESGLL